ncbi:MAG: [Fe-Fe] hydrogenase large subunit C-terminal domain-containing protein [Bacteroidales bacterium]|nr:4Fe-4S dicluster domain-containing protein [Bacteroidales bacterium]MBS3774958.1 4Fe-4S dicluster domain-containing protein [Bacteroidales bacterium]
MSLIQIIKDKCDLSYSCVRECPVNAIEVKVNTDYARIIPERCIGCGHCVGVCPQDAIIYRDSKQRAKDLLQSDEPTVAIVAPSISGEFDDIADYRRFVQMIRQLGFDYVNEVTFGADLIALKYKELFDNFKGKYYITSNCPAVVSHVEKYHPELINNLAPLVSPSIATAKVVRKKYGDQINVVYLGPCIDSKEEAKRHSNDDGKIDAVLTFVELRELFDEYNIQESKMEYSDFDPPIGYKGSLFPISNGLFQAAGISEDLLTGTVINGSGKVNSINAINQFEEGINQIKHHFNLFFCEGCLMGPGTSPGGKKYNRRSRVIDYANKRLETFDKKAWEEEIAQYINLDFSRGFQADDQRLEAPSEEKIQEVLKAIGKDNNQSNVGCSACGYPSCRDFAIAVSKGLAKTEMCLSYTLRNRNEYNKALRTTNEKLAQTQKALKESEQKARKEKQAAKEASETINAMLQKLPSAVVIIDQNLKVVQSNKTFVDHLGDEAQAINEVIPGLIGADLKSLLPHNILTLFSHVLENQQNIVNRDIYLEEKLLNLSIFNIKKGKIVGAVLRDMYAPEIRKEQVIKRVTEVIDKNLEMVQKIGYLLGEGASETEQMLNSIIEFYRSEKSIKPQNPGDSEKQEKKDDSSNEQ